MIQLVFYFLFSSFVLFLLAFSFSLSLSRCSMRPGFCQCRAAAFSKIAEPPLRAAHADHGPIEHVTIRRAFLRVTTNDVLHASAALATLSHAQDPTCTALAMIDAQSLPTAAAQWRRASMGAFRHSRKFSRAIPPAGSSGQLSCAARGTAGRRQIVWALGTGLIRRRSRLFLSRRDDMKVDRGAMRTHIWYPVRAALGGHTKR